jgi:hypothetical protein
LLTGILTGIGKWSRRGDASLVGRVERKAAVLNARAEAERLAKAAERPAELPG